MTEHRIVFTPSGLSGTVEHGSTVLDAARSLGVDLDSVCGGRGLCGRCQITPGAGEFPKWDISATAESLSAWGSFEDDYRGRRPIAEANRLGCAAQVCGDIVIDVPAESQIHKQVVRKDIDLDDLDIDPLLSLHYIEIPDPTNDDGTAVLDRVQAQLTHDWQLDDLAGDLTATAMVQAAATTGRGYLTVAVRNGAEIVAAYPNYVDRIVGMAVDIGSTTIAGHLADLATGEILASAGRMNPQIRFGEDLMSRVSYVMMNPGGEVELTAAVRSALDELLGELVEQADVDRSIVLDIVLVGNPIMHHLLLGFDAVPLGQAPFPLATDQAVEARATDVDIDAPGALYVAPCIAGHVGADTAAVILSEGPHRGDEIQLLVDVGTNAEIVLGNREQLFAASSPTGPAFEGAQISAGQRATAGAIERVRIDRETLEPRLRVIGSELWSDEDGFNDATAATGITGICGSGIIEVVSELFLAGVIDSNGVISPPATPTDRVVADERTFSYVMHRGPDGAELRVTQGDVRAIQLAKAALRAGIDLLLEHAELTTVDRIGLAGAFGAHIDPVHAMVLGLIPDCPVEAVTSVGNAAGSGAVRALLSGARRREMEQAVAAVTKIETATEPRFQELFVAAMAFPHLTASTTHLAQVVELPAPTAASDGRGRRRRSAQRSRRSAT